MVSCGILTIFSWKATEFCKLMQNLAKFCKENCSPTHQLLLRIGDYCGFC